MLCSQRAKMETCARKRICVQRRASGAVLTNGGYWDVFAMLAAGQLRVQMGAELRLTLKYKLVPARDDRRRVMIRIRSTLSKR